MSLFSNPMQEVSVSATNLGINAYGIYGSAASAVWGRGIGAAQDKGAAEDMLILVYLHHNATHSTNVSTGVSFGSEVHVTHCFGEWVNPTDGSVTPAENVSAAGVPKSPQFAVDIALRLVCSGASSPPPSPVDGRSRYEHWDSVQGANYVPSYSTNDVKDIFRPGFWNATTVDRELGFAKLVAVNSLRVFVSHNGYVADNRTTDFIQNYQSFQRMMIAHNLSLMVTLGTGERAQMGSCNDTVDFVASIVSAEIQGAVIAYEADNEPTTYMFDYLINCTLPALHAASRNPNVDISVGLAHVEQVNAFKDHVTTLNWHSYNGKNNGGGLQGEIEEVQKYMNKFNPPKQLVVSEWLARPAQPLASAYPVLRDNHVVGYAWALVIVDCTTHWNRPLISGDPPFQGLIWPNGTLYDDTEEGECMRHQCRTLQYVHHCCNNPLAGGMVLNSLWKFSAQNNFSDWQSKVFGSPVFKLPGPREGSMRWTNVSNSSVVIGPLPHGTKQVALYLPRRPQGASYTVALDGTKIHVGTTQGDTNAWVMRALLSVNGGTMLKVSVGDTLGGALEFSIYGVTFFATA